MKKILLSASAAAALLMGVTGTQASLIGVVASDLQAGAVQKVGWDDGPSWRHRYWHRGYGGPRWWWRHRHRDRGYDRGWRDRGDDRGRGDYRRGHDGDDRGEYRGRRG